MHKNYKLDEITQLQICIKVSLTDSNNKIKLTISYPKFNIANLVICYFFSPLTSYLNMINLMYQFKYPLGEFFSNKKPTSV